jgi:hypothetical protein
LRRHQQEFRDPHRWEGSPKTERTRQIGTRKCSALWYDTTPLCRAERGKRREITTRRRLVNSDNHGGGKRLLRYSVWACPRAPVREGTTLMHPVYVGLGEGLGQAILAQRAGIAFQGCGWPRLVIGEA